jgi:hypothetical protein
MRNNPDKVGFADCSQKYTYVYIKTSGLNEGINILLFYKIGE